MNTNEKYNYFLIKVLINYRLTQACISIYFVCTCVCMHHHVWLHHTHMSVYMYVYMHDWMHHHVCMSVRMHHEAHYVCMHVCTIVHACMHYYTCMSALLYMYVCMYTIISMSMAIRAYTCLDAGSLVCLT